MTLADNLRQKGIKSPKRRDKPLWDGPESSGDQGGVTQSMLSRFLSCRERFRIYTMEGLRPADTFNHRIHYGEMWHICEEELAKVSQSNCNPVPILEALKNYSIRLCHKYRMQQEQIVHWYNVCKIQFHIYVDWWASHQDMLKRTPLLQEYVFKVPYKLPSGKIVYLRGKWDSVDLVEGKGIVLQENKSKGDIREGQIVRQLTFDLQVMFYLVALHTVHNQRKEEIRDTVRGMGNPVILDTTWVQLCKETTSGVRYNVVRRPLSGGKGTIVQHKPTKSNPEGESKEQFYARLADIIRNAVGPEWGCNHDEHHFFKRWNVDISTKDIDRFRHECLDPILESMCEWFKVVSFEGCKNPFGEPMLGIHWRHPFGVYNVLDEGGSSDLDEYLTNGGEAGLERVENLFPELKDK